MGTRVKVRQRFEQGVAGTGQTPFLGSVIIGPLMRSISRALAGQYDTTDDAETCFALPEIGSGTTAKVDFFKEVPGDPQWLNADFPDLSADAEDNLDDIISNRNAYRQFKESGRLEVAAANGGWGNGETFKSFHPKLVPGSVFVARRHTASITLGGSITEMAVTDFPLTNDGGGSVRADAVVPGSVQVSAGGLVYTEGSDYTIIYDFDRSPGGGNTRWIITLPTGSRLSSGEVVNVTFDGRFPLKFGTGLDVTPDWDTGSLTNNSEAITDAIFYYGFWPVVSLAAYMRERVGGTVTRLPATDYTVKDVGSGNQLCVRTGVQGALMERSGFTLSSTLEKGNYTCGTKSEQFDVRGPCGDLPECDTLRICIYNEGTTAEEDVVFNGPLGGGDDGLVNASDIIDDINNNAVLTKYIVAYEDSGKVCIRLRDPDKGDSVVAPNVDMRGANNWFQVKPNSRDFAPVLGLTYDRICGLTQYKLTDSGAGFQDQQDTFANVLGSVIIDTAGNRYLVDDVVSDDVVWVTHVDSDGDAICGGGLVAPDGSGAWKLYYSAWSAEILATYGAVRSDLGTELLEIENADEDLLAKLGQGGSDDTHFSLGPENPLAYALAGFAFPNAGTSIYVLPLTSDDVSGYSAAADVLEVAKEGHKLFPLTFDEDKIGVLDSHVQEMADPDVSYEPRTRKLYTSGIARDAEIIADSVNEGASVRVNLNPASRVYTDATVDPTNYDATTGKAKIFRLVDGDDSTTNFVTDGVKAGMKVRLLTGLNAGDYRISRVITTSGGSNSYELELTIDDERYFQWDPMFAENTDPSSPSGTNQNGLMAYVIFDELTKSEHAAAAALISSAYSANTYVQRHIRHWGPLFRDDATPDGRSAVVPGYFLNCGWAGAGARVPVQQGATNFPIRGAGEILYSKGYFSFRQLDSIEQAGVWVWQNEDDNQSYHARQQFTVAGADPSQRLASQEHITNIADSMHRRLWNSLIGFTGKYNIVPETVTAIRTIIEGVLNAAKNSTAPRLGGEILDGAILTLRCHPTLPRTLEVHIQIDVAESLDVIDITMVVRRG